MATVDENVAKVHRGDDLPGSVRENTTSLCTSVSVCFFSAELCATCSWSPSAGRSVPQFWNMLELAEEGEGNHADLAPHSGQSASTTGPPHSPGHHGRTEVSLGGGGRADLWRRCDRWGSSPRRRRAGPWL